MSRIALAAAHGRAAILTPDGELLTLSAAEASKRLAEAGPPLLVHGPATFRRLGLRPGPAFDLLELFAFVLPARSVPPTAGGLADALGLARSRSLEAEAALLPDIEAALLARLRAAKDVPANAQAAGIAARMGRGGWRWAPAVAEALGAAPATGDGFRVWRRLPLWDEGAPPPPPAQHPVPPEAARARLSAILGPDAEQRPSQADYAHAVSTAFAPREAAGDPRLVLAEAGTGTGKTLGYIAPASLWAERNGAPVWISTFTKHLQRQIEGELTRLHTDPAERRRRVVIRKGRENYLCLLNFEDAVGTALAGNGAGVIPLGLLARWAEASADGDLVGGDLPGWFGELFGAGIPGRLADRRGECLHGACTHHRRCFVEHTIRRARTAELVIANHALVMAQAAWGGLDGETVPTRYVFDEGHQLFEAADSAFSAEISGIEGAELRRWLLGTEGGASRARGLKRRIDDIVVGEAALEAPLEALLLAARILPGGAAGQAGPFGAFLASVAEQVRARSPKGDDPSAASLEADLYPASEGLVAAAAALGRGLARIAEPLAVLIARLEAKLEADADLLDEAGRTRIEASLRGLRHRVRDPVSAWRAMLDAVAAPVPEPGQRPDHVHILRLERREAGEDASYCRHFLDPTLPFALTLARPAHGLLVTSATLRDSSEDGAEADWEAAEARTGAAHLPSRAYRAAVPSPFDYAAQTRCFVVSDVGPDIAALAGAYRALFLAVGGGGLGLFTAIARLRAVAARIAEPLEAAGIRLLAQHVDAMDNATLVDIFRHEENACLLGTDAMRDGVDVPGRSLRLVVFERTPWPRPDILHRERRLHLSGGAPRAYDERVARLRLRQAFGRLIRRGNDRGVFVLLDRRVPTRLLSAFPPGVEVQRVGLAAAIEGARTFLAEPPG